MAWSASFGAPLWPVASDGTAIYVTSSGDFSAGGSFLTAVSPADGHVLWTYSFGAVFGIGQPTVADGHVFVADCNGAIGTFMDSLVAENGTLAWSQSFPAQWDTYWAPLVIEGRVYFDGGMYGGLYAFDENSGAQVFYQYEEQWDSWSPLFFDNTITTFTDGNLRMFSAAAGSVIRSDPVQWSSNTYSMKTSPVSDGTSLYVVAPPSLYSFGPGLGTPRWTATGSYTSQPAVAAGVVYSTAGGQLRANDAMTGSLLWTFAGDSALSYPPVVAAGYVYVASDAHTYAVDSATQTQAWANTPGGWLSIAGGQLLAAGNTGTLVALVAQTRPVGRQKDGLQALDRGRRSSLRVRGSVGESNRHRRRRRFRRGLRRRRRRRSE